MTHHDRPDEPSDEPRVPMLVGIPRLSRAHLSRPRLVRALDGDGDVPLRILQAPAGYGKTSLLAEWVRTRQAHRGATLWVTVEGENRRRQGFWTHVVGLLNATGLARGGGLDGITITVDILSSLPSILLSGFGSMSRPLALVIDGFDSIEDPAVEADLLYLLRHASNFYLAVGTRTATSLSTPKTALAVDAVLVDAPALAFTVDEVSQLADKLDSPLTSEEARAFHAACDGWPLAVRAGVQAPRDNPWPSASERDGVSRVQRMLVDDLVGLPGFDDLVITSVVDRFTVEQAELLGADILGHPILTEVEARGLGAWEERADGQWFRVQPLVREALLAHVGETRGREAHRRLTFWYEKRGEYTNAFESALIAQEWQRARRLMATSLRQIAGGIDRRWIRRVVVPRQVLRSEPVLALFIGMAHYGLGDVGKAVRTLAAGVANAEWKRLSERGAVSVDHLWAQGAVTLGLRFAGRDELVQPALRRLQKMLKRAVGPQDELLAFRSLFTTQAATTYLLLDRVDDAAAVLLDRSVVTWSSESGEWHPDSLSVLVHATAGHIDQARQSLAGLVDPAVPRYFNVGFYAVPKHIGAAYVHLEEHRPDLAEAQLAFVQPHWPTVEWWPVVLHARTLQRWHANGAADALRTLDAGLAEKSKKPLGAAMRAMLTALRAELLLATGRAAEARELVPARRVRSYPRLVTAKARCLLLAGAFDHALAFATEPGDDHRTTPRDRLNLLLIAASARLRSGDKAAAVRDFSDAVELADGIGLRSPFAAMSRQDFAELAAAVPGCEPLRDEVEMFPVLFPEPEDVVPLTRRELVVLAELATSATIPEIAERLSVAAGTVKTQRRSIYRKLGVSSRKEAVTEARRRGIL